MAAAAECSARFHGARDHFSALCSVHHTVLVFSYIFQKLSNLLTTKHGSHTAAQHSNSKVVLPSLKDDLQTITTLTKPDAHCNNA